MRVNTSGALRAVTLLALGSASLPTPALSEVPAGDWHSYGRDVAGSHYSPLRQITAGNVGSLASAWRFALKPADSGTSRFLFSNMTPLAINGVLYLATPYGKVVALDGDTGAVRWSYSLPGEERVGGRGIEYWAGDQKTGPRIFVGTMSGKLLAIDLATGVLAKGFETIDLKTPEVMNGTQEAHSINSAPIMYEDVLITGSKLQESPALGSSGDVRGWDARTGKLLWTFHSIPRPGEPFHETWQGGGDVRRSGVNVWTLMTVDQQRGLVYLPFGAPTYDRIGIDRPGANLFSNSLVAVDARTGKYRWHFQAVHHDIWDLDMPTQPTLMDVKRGDQIIPAIVAITKSGHVFILDRVTGKPVYDVQEVPMPASSLPGETAWPTQPIPSAPPPLVRQAMTIDDIATLTPEHKQYCLDRVRTEAATFAVPFEPLRGDHPVIRFPGSGGGPNWGGGAFDPATGYFIINTNNVGSIEQMGQDANGNWRNISAGSTWFAQGKSMPCQQPPWGELTAVDISRGTIAWHVPLGITDSLPPALQATGRPNVGGPVATAGGIVFIGAADDARFRAFDSKSGKELWTVKLGAAAHATPITYEGRNGRQYVAVISAGGAYLGSPVTTGELEVFALPETR